MVRPLPDPLSPSRCPSPCCSSVPRRGSTRDAGSGERAGGRRELSATRHAQALRADRCPPCRAADGEPQTRNTTPGNDGRRERSRRVIDAAQTGLRTRPDRWVRRRKPFGSEPKLILFDERCVTCGGPAPRRTCSSRLPCGEAIRDVSRAAARAGVDRLHEPRRVPAS